MPQTLPNKYCSGASSQNRNNTLVKQLCQYTANLEETNINLQQEILKFDEQHQHLCLLYGYSTWSQLYEKLIEDGGRFSKGAKKIENTRLYLKKQKSQKSPNIDQKTNLSESWQNSQIKWPSSFNKTQNLAYNFTYQLRDTCKDENMSSGAIQSEYSACTTPINALSNFSNQSPTPQSSYSRNIKLVGKICEYEDGEESPIRSESRVLSRTIRGDTDRYNQEQEYDGVQFLQQTGSSSLQKFVHKDQQYGTYPSFSDGPQEFGFNSENSYQHYQKVNNRKPLKQKPFNLPNSIAVKQEDSEEENLLLSMQNTKLRQKLAKLEAVIEDRKYNY